MTVAAAAPAACAPPAGAAAFTARQRLLLLAITAAAAALRWTRLEHWSWGEAEAAFWCDVAGLPGGGSWSLLPALMRAVLGEPVPDAALRLPFACAGVLTVPALAAWARATGAGAGVLAAAVLALHPLHVELGQSCRPLGVALLFAVAAAWAVARRCWPAAGGAMLVAGLCDPLAWVAAVPMVLAGRPQSAQRLVLAVALLVAVPVLAPALALLAPPLLLLAIAGAVLRWPAAGLALAAVVPAAAAGALAPWRGAIAGDDAAIAALPGLVLLAAAAAHRLHALARQHLDGPPVPVRVAGSLAGLLLAAWLVVDTFLYLQLHQGRRPPWRAAVAAAQAVVPPAASLELRAGAGYLPAVAHWPRPDGARAGAVPVVHGDPGHPAGRQALLAPAPGREPVLLLRRDELARFAADPAAHARLWAEFTLVHVGAAPRALGDDTVYVFARRGP